MTRYLPVSDWELEECQQRVERALLIPKAHRVNGALRTEALQRIADDYGVSTRTLYRWRKRSLQEVRVGKYRALFFVEGRPSQVTAWERAA